MKNIWTRIDSWLENNAVAILNDLQSGATEEEIKIAESFLGVEFTQDVRDSFQIHNGQFGNKSFLEPWQFLSLDGIMVDWKIWKELLDAGDFDNARSEPNVGIRSDWWNPRWIPLTYDGCGNHHCLDLDPTPSGKVGQIITMWHDEVEREVGANSFREWLEKLADELESGIYVFSQEQGSLIEVDEDNPGSFFCFSIGRY